MFGAMGLLGYFTKKDLSTMGRFLIMALIGLIIATIVNIFWANSTLYWITTYAGILIFAGLTAYDTQKIKNMLVAHGTEVNDSTMKLALLGSLDLYLDFINLFIYLLRIFGNKK
jgi:FtsH-binding integral membrane protein